MPFCEYCGRPIADNEVCNCRNVSPKKDKKPLSPAIKITIAAIVLIIVAFFAHFFYFAHDFIISERTQTANSGANSIHYAVNSIIAEMGEDGYNAKGYYLISSDRSKNINIPDYLDEDSMYKRIHNFNSDSEKYDWFAVVENDCVTYSAYAYGWKGKPVGSYPASDYSGIYYYDTGFFKTKDRKKATLQMLYADTEKKVRQKAEDADFLQEIMTATETAKE